MNAQTVKALEEKALYYKKMQFDAQDKGMKIIAQYYNGCFDGIVEAMKIAGVQVDYDKHVVYP